MTNFCLTKESMKSTPGLADDGVRPWGYGSGWTAPRCPGGIPKILEMTTQCHTDQLLLNKKSIKSTPGLADVGVRPWGVGVAGQHPDVQEGSGKNDQECNTDQLLFRKRFCKVNSWACPPWGCTPWSGSTEKDHFRQLQPDFRKTFHTTLISAKKWTCNHPKTPPRRRFLESQTGH